MFHEIVRRLMDRNNVQTVAPDAVKEALLNVLQGADSAGFPSNTTQEVMLSVSRLPQADLQTRGPAGPGCLRFRWPNFGPLMEGYAVRLWRDDRSGYAEFRFNMDGICVRSDTARWDSEMDIFTGRIHTSRGAPFTPDHVYFQLVSWLNQTQHQSKATFPKDW